MVTAATLNHEHHFHSSTRLELLQNTLFELAVKYEWELNAWALFSNHYHFVAQTKGDPKSLKRFLMHLHANMARDVNRLDAMPGRMVWFQLWDTRLTFEKSYLARLRYTHENATHHGLVTEARGYPFCSAAWFEMNASHAFQKTLSTFKIDKIKMSDDYSPVWPNLE